MSRREVAEAVTADRLPVNTKVPEEELMSDILKRLTGDSALPIYSNVEKFKRGKDGAYSIAEDIKETVKKREMVNAKERLRVGVFLPIFWYMLSSTLLVELCFLEGNLVGFGSPADQKRHASMLAC